MQPKFMFILFSVLRWRIQWNLHACKIDLEVTMWFDVYLNIVWVRKCSIL